MGRSTGGTQPIETASERKPPTQFELARVMGTSMRMIERTLRDAARPRARRDRQALDALDTTDAAPAERKIE
jgi:transcriptional regulator with XRE-family HTH domain